MTTSTQASRDEAINEKLRAIGECHGKRTPSQSIRIRTSEDGRFIIVESIESWILPRRYMGKIVENAEIRFRHYEESRDRD